MGKGAATGRLPRTLGGPKFILALERGETWDKRVEIAEAVAASAGLAVADVECVHAEELADPHTESDLAFGLWHPAVAGSRRVCTTMGLEDYEQDPAGIVWRRRAREGGAPEPVYLYPPLALMEMPEFRQVARPSVGLDHVLLFAAPAADDGRIPVRGTLIPDILLVHGDFRTLVGPGQKLPLGRRFWLGLVRQVLDREPERLS